MRKALILTCLSGIRFAAWLLAVLFLCGMADRPPTMIRVHLQAQEGNQGQTSLPVQLFQPQETVSIRAIPELSEKDVRQVTVRSDGSVLVDFDAFGQAKLEAATSTGRGLILVVIVNTRVVYAPMIDTVLTQGLLLLPAGAMTQAEVEQINGEVLKTNRGKLKDINSSRAQPRGWMRLDNVDQFC